MLYTGHNALGKMIHGDGVAVQESNRLYRFLPQAGNVPAGLVTEV
jgi:hypothetical protein